MPPRTGRTCSRHRTHESAARAAPYSWPDFAREKLAACAEAISHGVHSADVILNILARQRDPGPPITILTPAALALRHEPVADRARYDNLRRTV